MISQGLIVDYQQNWKDRGWYDTAVVAAPITIGTEDHIAAVVLTRSNQTNWFYVHEVLTIKNGASPFKTGALNQGLPGGDAPSVFSIRDRIRAVKNQTGIDERFSVDATEAAEDVHDLDAVIGDIVQNAIPINALHNKADGVDGTYAIDDRGREFVSIVTVEQQTNTVAGINAYDMTHAISGRQKRSGRQEPTASIGASQADTKSQGVNLIKASSEISITDLLEAVKEVYQSILPDDVLDHMGESRNPKGHYTGRVRYSFAGENANNADLDALEQAKEMRAAGVADETIRQRTGWHTGMDGKWRWEITTAGCNTPAGAILACGSGTKSMTDTGL